MEEQKKYCKMVEDRTEIYCSECGMHMSDEIYSMFKGSKDDFKFCPGCGRRIVLTPEEFKEQMELIAKIKYAEDQHIKADDLICALLEGLGYQDGIKIFKEMEKWYS